MPEIKVNPNQIDISNESSIDLLIKQNKAKAILADNLNGLGVSADASTDTLEQLATKVSTAVVDNSRQKIECLAVGYINSFAEGRTKFIIKNDWLFFVERDNDWNLGLCYIKLSNLKSQLTTPGVQIDDYTRAFISLSGTDISNTNDKSILQFSEDGQYLYLIGSQNIYRYTATWGTNYSTLSLGSRITITPVDSSNDGIYISTFDIKADNSEMLIYDIYSHLYKLNISNLSSDTTVTATLLYGNATGDCHYFYTETDNQICCFKKDSSDYVFYLYNFTTSTEINEDTSKTQHFNFSSQGAEYWRVAFNKFKDSNNRYRIIFNVGGLSDEKTDDAYKVFSFVIFDCYNKVLNSYQSKVAWTRDNDQKNYPVTVYSYNSKYYVLAGIELLIFDSSWNLLGNAINYWDTSSPWFSYSFIYENEIYALNGDRMESVIRQVTYFDKQIAYARTVAVENKPTRQEVYFAQLRQADLEDGYFD